MPATVQIFVEAVDQAQAILARISGNVASLNKSNTESIGIAGRLNAVWEAHRITMLAITGVVVGVQAAFVAYTKGAVDNADQLGKLSQKTGVAVAALSTLSFAARLSNVDSAEFALSMRGLSKAMVDARDGTGEGAVAFDQLGLSVRDAQGRVKGTEAVLFDIAEAFSKMADGAEKSDLAVRLFGRSGTEMIPFLNEGRAGIEKLQAQARALGLEISEGTAKAAEKFNDNMTLVNGVARGAATTIATQLLPTLIKVTDALAEHPKIVAGAFTAISLAVTAATTGFAAYKIALLATAVQSALFTSTTMAIAGTLVTIPVRLAAVGAAMAALPIAAVAAGLALLTAGLFKWAEAKHEAAANKDIEASNERMLVGILKLIDAQERLGKINTTEAQRRRQVVADAVKEARESEDQASAQQKLGDTLQTLVGGKSSEAAKGALLAEKTRLAQLSAAQQQFFQISELQRGAEQSDIQARFDARLSSVAEFESASVRLAERTADAKKKFLKDEADVAIKQANLEAKSNQDKAIAIGDIESKLATNLIAIDIARDTEILGFHHNAIQKTIDLDKAGAQGQIDIATHVGQTLVAKKLAIQQQFKALRESLQQVDPADRPTESQIAEAERVANLRAERDATLELARSNLELAKTEVELRLAKIDAIPGLSDLDRKRLLVPVQQQLNALLGQERDIEREITTSPISTDDEKVAAAKKLVALQIQQVQLKAKIEEPPRSNTPQFDSALGLKHGFENGQITTTGQLLEPFKALDTFLAGTLQTTFQGLSDAITGIITGTKTWGQVAVQVGNSIIAGIVQLVLEYTVFHGIRMLLDNIFHNNSLFLMGRSLAAGESAKALSTSTSVAASAKVAGAAAPAAAGTSIWSFGAAATIGLVLAIAAIGAIVGALAFAGGGLIPGAPSDTDNRLARVAAGEFVIPSRIVKALGAAHFERYLSGANPTLALHIPRLAAGGLVGPDMSGLGNFNMESAGLLRPAAPTVNVSPADVNVAIFDDHSKFISFLQSKPASKVILGLIAQNRTNLGIPS